MRISIGLSIVYYKGSHIEYINYAICFVPRFVIMLAKNADPDNMQHYAIFYLGFAVCKITHLEVRGLGPDIVSAAGLTLV